MYDAESVRVNGRWNLLQRRLVASGDDSSEWDADGAIAPTTAATDTHADVDTSACHEPRGVHHAQSVRSNGRRNLLQRRLAASRHQSSERCHDATATATTTAPAADDSGRLRDAEPVRRDGGADRCVLQRRLVPGPGTDRNRSID